MGGREKNCGIKKLAAGVIGRGRKLGVEGGRI